MSRQYYIEYNHHSDTWDVIDSYSEEVANSFYYDSEAESYCYELNNEEDWNK